MPVSCSARVRARLINRSKSMPSTAAMRSNVSKVGFCTSCSMKLMVCRDNPASWASLLSERRRFCRSAFNKQAIWELMSSRSWSVTRKNYRKRRLTSDARILTWGCCGDCRPSGNMTCEPKILALDAEPSGEVMPVLPLGLGEYEPDCARNPGPARRRAQAGRRREVAGLTQGVRKEPSRFRNVTKKCLDCPRKPALVYWLGKMNSAHSTAPFENEAAFNFRSY